MTGKRASLINKGQVKNIDKNSVHCLFKIDNILGHLKIK